MSYVKNTDEIIITDNDVTITSIVMIKEITISVNFL